MADDNTRVYSALLCLFGVICRALYSALLFNVHYTCIADILNISKMGKKSKSRDVSLSEEQGDVTLNDQEMSFEDKLNFVSAIAKPMASKSQSKKIYKLIKKASKEKAHLRSGLKEVQRRIRLGEKGICVFAGDVSPIEVMCHMPGVCEEKKIPYCYTPSRADLGSAMGVKRGTVMVMVRPHDSYQDAYDQVLTEVNSLPLPEE